MNASIVSSAIPTSATSKVAEVVTSVVSSVTSGATPTATATAQNVASVVKTAIKKLPTSFYIKMGVLTGVAVFSAVVMVRKWLKQKKFKEQVHTSGTLFNDYKDTVDVDPIDEYLGMGYTEDPEKFDDLDPLMKRIAKNFKPKLSKAKKRKLRKIWDEYKRETPAPEYVTWAKGISKAYLAEVDAAARACGLDVEYTIDDNMPLERRRRFNEKLGFGYLDDIG